jgi:hypothetical protein
MTQLFIIVDAYGFDRQSFHQFTSPVNSPGIQLSAEIYSRRLTRPPANLISSLSDHGSGMGVATKGSLNLIVPPPH